MNRDVCEHFTPAGIPCVKCQTSPRLEKAMATESELLRGSDTPITDAWWSSVTTCARDTKQTVDHLREARAGMSLMERELASLRAEKERADSPETKAKDTAENTADNPKSWTAWKQRAERAEAERDAAVKDAERYRHIESRVAAVDLGWMFTLTQIPTTTFGEAIDAAIAARKGEQ